MAASGKFNRTVTCTQHFNGYESDVAFIPEISPNNADLLPVGANGFGQLHISDRYHTLLIIELPLIFDERFCFVC